MPGEGFPLVKVRISPQTHRKRIGIWPWLYTACGFAVAPQPEHSQMNGAHSIKPVLFSDRKETGPHLPSATRPESSFFFFNLKNQTNWGLKYFVAAQIELFPRFLQNLLQWEKIPV